MKELSIVMENNGVGGDMEEVGTYLSESRGRPR